MRASPTGDGDRAGPRGAVSPPLLAAALVFVGLAAGCSTDSGAEPAWLPSLESVPCSRDVASTLATWGAGDDVLTAPPAPGSLARYRISTDALGVWILLEVDRAEATVRLVTPERVSTRAFASDCTLSTSEDPTPPPGGERVRFTDEDLRRVVRGAAEEGAHGVVVYVWSPHMSLSVDGYREIAAAAAGHRLHVVPVLFPGSDPSFAAAEAERVGIPAAGLREAASVELTFRDAQVHAPSILVFDGHRVSAVLPGYRSAEGYREFLTEFVAAS